MVKITQYTKDGVEVVDIPSEYELATTDKQKMDAIAKKLGLI